ncbi:MAG: hypothetical protein D6698_03190 [Gammaproteobacteria bacterium]|nr:MAG: hypothetical protein D6698_03190 [Gammaproteobacteria bacterium]
MEYRFDPAWIDTADTTEVYKQDQRSRVWRIEVPDGGSYVIKRYEFNPLRQKLGWLIGRHPAQREIRQAARLSQLGLPVVPTIAHGWAISEGASKVWLVTPYMGQSLFHLFYHQKLSDPDRRGRILDMAGRFTGELIRRGLFNRDHKASNLLVDSSDWLWLIDSGGVRPMWSVRGGATRMIRSLQGNLAEAGAGPADLARLARTCSSYLEQN